MKFVKLGGFLLIILAIVIPQQVLANSDYEKTNTVEINAATDKSKNNQSENKVEDNNSSNSESTQEEQLEIKEKELQAAKEAQLKAKKEKLENEIKKYLGNNINNIGLSYYDVTSGESININSDKTFLAASTVKVQLNMILADMFANGQASQSEQLTYTQADYEEGTGILQDTNLSNKSYVTATLSDYSIIHSDNIATNMIMRRIGYENFRNLVDKKLGTATNHSGNYITASQETSILRKLYENEDSNSYYLHIIDIMKKTDFHDRLDKYINTNIVAHKVGNYGNYVNDVGIVYTNKPYIISIYTEGVSNTNEVIAHISKLIYDYQNEK
ncbi:hypothetical protein CPAST_c10740 [Clostridium pasteurianum DSM 525 = ATCC 6013]|uniref:Beta-lactamase class A catalytic domain-containing protein n=1 Tax=Clostridium pasteurianum DSM 525 = ATCC 6013 TaxID=1262449 RepID=A0A0H3J1C8_CLOPA|nr:serine hydrolase [Clostridium pasteurianum]AJA47174.1 hypothetical protein CPAST_c10740 [Clostridium pasteurianum DSM 525 = ATCC 6013]AJA51162.1 hypothetical protein CLPA_c10740 [Clostridium pasteurianum DSM 525 = ATCC 6013]AOZ74530.1 hypothetical protein AQ983_05195 [Clostridium pasteurianum DSM 525 = ATCC 6013]AOZ78327.1 hypothetical protein AQ984_05185 [Clostridium pasteurianum]ELP59441.1 hypothetical protein F502_09158 [Clostridium pasteurianum DSM 525 = ATCC 6013]